LTPKKGLNSNEHLTLWVNFPLRGEPLDVYLTLKERGIVHSTRDSFVQGLRCLQEKIVEFDLKRAQLAASKRLNEEF